jgi:hypothetical protein
MNLPPCPRAPGGGGGVDRPGAVCRRLPAAAGPGPAARAEVRHRRRHAHPQRRRHLRRADFRLGIEVFADKTIEVHIGARYGAFPSASAWYVSGGRWPSGGRAGTPAAADARHLSEHIYVKTRPAANESAFGFTQASGPARVPSFERRPVWLLSAPLQKICRAVRKRRCARGCRRAPRAARAARCRGTGDPYSAGIAKSEDGGRTVRATPGAVTRPWRSP